MIKSYICVLVASVWSLYVYAASSSNDQAFTSHCLNFKFDEPLWLLKHGLVDCHHGNDVLLRKASACNNYKIVSYVLNNCDNNFNIEAFSHAYNSTSDKFIERELLDYVASGKFEHILYQSIISSKWDHVFLLLNLGEDPHFKKDMILRKLVQTANVEGVRAFLKKFRNEVNNFSEAAVDFCFKYAEKMENHPESESYEIILETLNDYFSDIHEVENPKYEPTYDDELSGEEIVYDPSNLDLSEESVFDEEINKGSE